MSSSFRYPPSICSSLFPQLSPEDRCHSIQGLMGTLVQCQPHFIRCIKPNPASQPGQLDPEYVLEQLRAGGVLEAVRIACAGFPTRKLFRWVGY